MKHQESEKSQNMSKMDTVESDESLLTYHSSALLARTWQWPWKKGERAPASFHASQRWK